MKFDDVILHSSHAVFIVGNIITIHDYRDVWMLFKQNCVIDEIVINSDKDGLIIELKNALESSVATVKCLRVEAIIKEMKFLFSWAKSKNFPFVELKFFIDPYGFCIDSIRIIMETPGLPIKKLRLNFRHYSDDSDAISYFLSNVLSPIPCYLTELSVVFVDPTSRRIVYEFTRKLKVQEMLMIMISSNYQSRECSVIVKMPIELIRMFDEIILHLSHAVFVVGGISTIHDHREVWMLFKQNCVIDEIVVYSDKDGLIIELKNALEFSVATLKRLRIQAIISEMKILLSWAKSKYFPFVEFEFLVDHYGFCLGSIRFIMETPGLPIKKLHLNFRHVRVDSDVTDHFLAMISSPIPCYLTELSVGVVDPTIRRIVDKFTKKLKVQELFLLLAAAKKQPCGMLKKIPNDLLRMTRLFVI